MKSVNFYKQNRLLQVGDNLRFRRVNYMLTCETLLELVRFSSLRQNNIIKRRKSQIIEKSLSVRVVGCGRFCYLGRHARCSCGAHRKQENHSRSHSFLLNLRTVMVIASTRGRRYFQKASRMRCVKHTIRVIGNAEIKKNTFSIRPLIM